MTRAELIAAGKVWTVYPASNPVEIWFEGKSRSRCLRYLRAHNLIRDYKRGTVRIGKTIWEPETT